MANRLTITFLRRILTDRRATAAVEFSLIAAVFFLFVFSIIDFSRALWEWNMAARATQAGVRYAVAHDPAAAEIKTFSAITLMGGNGISIPINQFNGGNPVVCQKDGNGDGTCGAGWTFDGAAFTNIVEKVSAVYPAITEQDVIVEYQHVGIGFSGNPFGSDISPLITVKLKPRVFTLVTPGLSAISTINMPDFTAVMTGESVRDTNFIIVKDLPGG